MTVRCLLSYLEFWDRARRRFVCRLTVQTPKGEIINQVIFSLLSFFNQQCIRLIRVSNPFPFTQIYLYYMNSVVRFSNCIYFALRTRYLYKAVNEWKLNCKRRNEGVVWEKEVHKRNQISPLSGFIFAQYLSFIHVFILMAFIGVERACFGLCVCVVNTGDFNEKNLTKYA